jgi:hypothetical protein
MKMNLKFMWSFGRITRARQQSTWPNGFRIAAVLKAEAEIFFFSSGGVKLGLLWVVLKGAKR